MKTLFVKACEYCVQQVNGRQSMIGIFDSIVCPMIPVDHPPFFICIQIEFLSEEAGLPFELLVRLIDEDGRRIIELPIQGTAPAEPMRGISRIFASFHVPGFRLETTGEYRIDVLINGRKEAEERIPVLVAAQNTEPS